MPRETQCVGGRPKKSLACGTRRGYTDFAGRLKNPVFIEVFGGAGRLGESPTLSASASEVL